MDQYSDRMGGKTQRRLNVGGILSVGFGTTIAMWAVGYFCRMPGDQVAAPVLLGLLVLTLLAGGFYACVHMDGRPLAGLLSGAVSGAVNLLILFTLGHHLSNDRRVIDYAAVWAPGFIIGCAVVEYIGAWIAALAGSARRRIDGVAAFPKVTAAALLLLLVAGGMVTGLNKGLAVPDWPDTYHWNMLMFPLSHMTGGVYFEHAHRLMGTLIGLTTMVLAIYLTFTRTSWTVKILSWSIFVMVCVQGALGGLRVTGHFTASTQRSHMDPSETIAIIHGIFAQIIFGALVWLCAVASRAWRTAASEAVPPRDAAEVDTERKLSTFLVVLLVLQLIMGALLRHLGFSLVEHIVTAAIILIVVLFLGARLAGLHARGSVARRIGIGLMILVAVQILLGISALLVLHGPRPHAHPTLLEAAVTTAHQINGALLLGTAVLAAVWTRRREIGDGQVAASANHSAKSLVGQPLQSA